MRTLQKNASLYFQLAKKSSRGCSTHNSDPGALRCTKRLLTRGAASPPAGRADAAARKQRGGAGPPQPRLPPAQGPLRGTG